MGYVYRYMCGDQWIYVGKSKVSVTSRVACHAKEPQFQPYLYTATVSYCQFDNGSDMDAVELALIKIYQPLLNKAGKTTSLFPFVCQEHQLQWIPLVNMRGDESLNKAIKYQHDLKSWFCWMKMSEETQEKAVFCNVVFDRILNAHGIMRHGLTISYHDAHYYLYGAVDWIYDFVANKFHRNICVTEKHISFAIPPECVKPVLMECSCWIINGRPIVNNANNLANTILQRINLNKSEALFLYRLLDSAERGAQVVPELP